jgi:hypothetical protein
MKTKIILSLLVMMLSFSSSYASFPVTRTAVSSTTVTASSNEELLLTSPAASAASDTMLVAGLLWFFLGWAAGHRWYLGSPIEWNILFILTLGGLGVWWIVDGIDIFTRNYPGM